MCLATGGRVIVVGSHGKVEVDPINFVLKESSATAVLVFNSTPEEYRTAGKLINKGAVDGWVRPIIGKKFSLTKAIDAHIDVIEGKGALGRTILTLE